MMFPRTPVAFAAVVALLPFAVAAQDAGGAERIRKTWARAEADLDKRLFLAESRFDDRFARLEARLAKSWDRVEKTGVRTLVDYADDGKSRVQVKFDEGKLVAEAIVPKARAEYAKADALASLTNRIVDMATNTDGNGIRMLKNQVSRDGLEKGFARPETVEYVAADSVPMVKIKVEVPLKTGHLSERAALYAPLAKQAADLYGVPVDLVLAIMETESSFNPYADNGIAFGLMQLVPTTGGVEASRTVFGKDKLLTRAELKNPELNVKLGAALLYRYLEIYLKNADLPRARKELLGTAAYNGGIGMALGFQNKNADGLRNASDDAWLAALIRHAPGETKHYLQTVPPRRAQYAGL